MRGLIIIATFILLVTAVAAMAVDAPRWIGVFPIHDKVGLKWQAVEGADTYAIYRSVAGGAAEKLTEVSELQYFDKAVEPGESYTYTLKAVAAGVEGPASEAKEVTMPGTKRGEMTGPVWVGIRMDRGRAMLNWDPMKNADVVAYNIKRGTTPGGPYETIGSTQESKYIDSKGLENGVTYYYILTALDENFDESPPSKEMAYTHGGSQSQAATAEDLVHKADLEEIPLEFDFLIDRGGDVKLNAPSDVCVASNGDIYISDVQNHRIVVCDSKGSFKFEFGSAIPADHKDNPPGGTFDLMFTLAMDAQDNLFVSDIGNGDIQKFDKSGKFLQRFETHTIEGGKKFCPTGLEVLEDGSMLVSDRDNHRIMKLDASGNVVWQEGSEGPGEGQFISPNEIAVNSKGNIYVLDVLNQRVQCFDPNGKFLSWFGGVGNIIGTFARPKGLYIDDQDRIWIADGLSNAIQIYGSDHKVHSTIGGFKDQKLWLNNPRGMVVRDGRFYVVDRNNGRLLVFRMS